MFSTKPAAGKRASPVALAWADPVLNPSVLTVPPLQALDLMIHHSWHSVCDERGDPVPIGVSEGQLRSRMRELLPEDQARFDPFILIFPPGTCHISGPQLRLHAP